MYELSCNKANNRKNTFTKSLKIKKGDLMFDFFKQQKNQNIENFEILENIPLHNKNMFETGGLAHWYCQPTDGESFQEALRFSNEKNLDTFVLGRGANVLISDEGFAGLVIHPAINKITIIDKDKEFAFVKAGSGVILDTLINYCLDNDILGLEEFSGIPSTIGGAVYINLHYYEFLLEQFLVSATLINKKTYEIITVDTNWFKFGYDQSKLQEKEFFVIDATFKLKKSNELAVAHAKGRYTEIIRHRNRRYPYERTCGSFFRNFFPHEVASTDKKLIYVAYYLDQLGVKGELTVGDATVSHQHANMIVNKGKATSKDILTLTQTMQQMVYEKYNIKPQPECQLIGFEKNPFA